MEKENLSLVNKKSVVKHNTNFSRFGSGFGEINLEQIAGKKPARDRERKAREENFRKIKNIN